MIHHVMITNKKHPHNGTMGTVETDDDNIADFIVVDGKEMIKVNLIAGIVDACYAEMSDLRKVNL